MLPTASVCQRPLTHPEWTLPTLPFLCELRPPPVAEVSEIKLLSRAGVRSRGEDRTRVTSLGERGTLSCSPWEKGC